MGNIGCADGGGVGICWLFDWLAGGVGVLVLFSSSALDSGTDVSVGGCVDAVEFVLALVFWADGADDEWADEADDCVDDLRDIGWVALFFMMVATNGVRKL
mmetsp:Transcript_4221/g.5742  ORF Transcript_4221/g.5742 Transcript_4221/m.5742 type:complete len:101 (-) Transcript_4221:654-956(-)|eukprot:CAMPEP_0185723806 /NCGR_PEP_ID=MMETSP1171-20130828/521_1 /TAXON_ID=374046 /ORGANISM="Helicotheca tamensis, Strain CCMP826" /LENGTH=100 /DNA_ID=CAMNT_0028391559 /DNA_START=275 /DNA_END=577 /DNA_ORIENTATION=+